MRALRWMIPLALLSACGEGMTPETLVNKLRVLGVRSLPAELQPGQSALLQALVEDPSRPGEPSSVLWLACDPDPLLGGNSACSNTQVLADGSGLGEQGLDPGALPPGMKVIGLNEFASYTAPAETFASLAADDRRRQLGTVAQVLLMAVAEEISPAATEEELRAVLERVRSKELPSLIALYRLRISEQGQVNSNPVLGWVEVEGAPMPRGATLGLHPGTDVHLDVTATDESFERYTRLTPDSAEEAEERLLGAWYATSGRFSQVATTLRGQVPQIYSAADEEDPEFPPDRRGTFWMVVRDTRGGMSWMKVPAYHCEAEVPVPTVEEVSPPQAAPGEQLILRGANLGSVLDVQLADAVLGNLSYSAATQELTGTVPALPPGSHPLTLRTRACSEVATSRQVEVP